jgi:hypothetical protein
MLVSIKTEITLNLTRPAGDIYDSQTFNSYNLKLPKVTSMFKIPLCLTRHLVSISIKVILWENGIFSDFLCH